MAKAPLSIQSRIKTPYKMGHMRIMAMLTPGRPSPNCSHRVPALLCSKIRLHLAATLVALSRRARQDARVRHQEIPAALQHSSMCGGSVFDEIYMEIL